VHAQPHRYWCPSRARPLVSGLQAAGICLLTNLNRICGLTGLLTTIVVHI
jgi:hypothetical protein